MEAMVRETALLGNLFYIGALGLALLGIFAVVAMRHLVRVILGLALLDSGVNLFLVATGYRPGAVAPILMGQAAGTPMVDPIPQALILTAIVIGVGVQAVALALAVQVHRAYGTLDLRELGRHVGGGAGDRRPAERLPVPRRGGRELSGGAS
jgi:multicomponent Na+:H+ antiporter subunit C